MTNQYPGVSVPFSEKEPTEAEIALTEKLENTLKKHGMYEDTERTEQREAALRHLDLLTQQFVRNVCRRRNVPPEYANKAGGAVFTYGSYKLGVNSADADIDTLCVVPSFVYRSDFFEDMLDILKNTTCITHITAVPDSYVPVIKFKYNDIPIDLVCARVNAPQVTHNINLQDSSILIGLDDRCIRSINGTRVAEDIMRLVPNLNTFKIALRCIKLWATKKAIYSNVMGFLGGVAWAILVARICQFYPNASASVVIGKFFNLLKAWNWNQPVLLQHIPDGPPLSSGLRPWKQNQNRNHRMPVITPSYPSMCATHNVTISTQRIILGEFNMAAQTVAKIMDGKLPWAALFQPHTFFQNYKYYLQVIVSGDSHEAFLKWSGYVEAKLRQLVTKLEAVDAIALVHPFVDGFNSQYTCSNPDDVWAATHGQIIPKNKRRPGTIVIHTKVFYIGLYIRMRPVEGSRTLDLTEPIGDFTRMLKGWSEFNRYHMGIVVENVRRDQLPETVRPQRDVAISKRSLSKSPSPSTSDSRSAAVTAKKMKTAATVTPIPVSSNNTSMIAMASTV